MSILLVGLQAGSLLAAFSISLSPLLTIVMLPPHRCSGCSFFVLESAFEAVSQFDLGGFSTPADENAFTPWHFEGVSLEKTLKHDRLVWDLTYDGPAG